MSMRRKSGASIADLPAVMWLLFVVILYPLIDLATVGMRYTFMVTTSREAAMAASRGKTFFADSSASDLSAVHLASAMAANAASRFTGITLTSVSTDLVVTNLNTNAVTRQTTPLATQPDIDNFLYAYEVTVTGNVWPLLPFKGPVFSNIPGLTGPMTVSITTQKMCENTQGLNQ